MATSKDANSNVQGVTKEGFRGSLIKQSYDAVSERSILSLSCIGVHNDVVVSFPHNEVEEIGVGGNGDLVVEDGRISTFFSGKPGSYDLRLIHPFPLEESNGLTVCYRLSGWNKIRYLAIGHTVDSTFRHVKISNPAQDEWVTFSVGYQDIAYRLRNDWKKATPCAINNVRVYVSGTPADANSACIELAWASIWLEGETKERKKFQSQSHPVLFDALKGYFRRVNPCLDDHAKSFLKSGACPMTGDVSLPWDIDVASPSRLSESGTYRYIWHALQPAVSLLVYGDDRDCPSAIFAARDYINSWLDKSYFLVDPDVKYAWYDHGTAERLLAFLMMHEFGVREKFDHRFMARLRHAIIKHGQLLESEVFYAFHQGIRYHNHAWFQDMALIAAGVAMSSLPCSSRWINRAIDRLEDQCRNLIVHDGPFSIFVENSIGYHHGIQSLVAFAGELVRISGSESSIPAIANQLGAWSEFFRYPDNRSPSQGDTFRKPNPLAPQDRIIRGNPYAEPSITVLPLAGYAVIKGNHEKRPFMLCMFATSLSETHKHEDDLSITLFFDGIEWLIDPSFYSHGYREQIPAFLRSARAHNRVVIDGVAHSSKPGGTRLKPLAADGLVVGESSAYPSVLLTRSIKAELDVLYLEVHDDISFKEQLNPFWLVFHCGEGVQARFIENRLVLSHPLSEYSMIINFPEGSTAETYEGLSQDVDWHGIAGSGFEQVSKTSLVRVKVQHSQINWGVGVSTEVH